MRGRLDRSLTLASAVRQIIQCLSIRGSALVRECRSRFLTNPQLKTIAPCKDQAGLGAQPGFLPFQEPS